MPGPAGDVHDSLYRAVTKTWVEEASADVIAPSSCACRGSGNARKRIPHLLLVRNLRFSMDAILQWELANSVRGGVPEAVVQIVEPEPEPDASVRVPRWHELVREQDGERCDSVRYPEQMSPLLAQSPPFRPFVP